MSLALTHDHALREPDGMEGATEQGRLSRHLRVVPDGHRRPVLIGLPVGVPFPHGFEVLLCEGIHRPGLDQFFPYHFDLFGDPDSSRLHHLGRHEPQTLLGLWGEDRLGSSHLDGPERRLGLECLGQPCNHAVLDGIRTDDVFIHTQSTLLLVVRMDGA